MAQVLDKERTVEQAEAQDLRISIAEPPDVPEAPPPSYLKLRKSRTILALTGLALLAGGIAHYSNGPAHASTDDAFIDGHVVAIGPRVAGQVQEVDVQDNQDVKQGQLLLRLDPSDFEVRLAQARAALQAAIARRDAASLNIGLTSGTTRAGLQQAHAAMAAGTAGVQTSHTQVAAAQSRLLQARAALAAVQAGDVPAQTDAGRYRQLFAEGAVSRQQLDAAQAAARSSAAQVRNAEAVVQAAQAAVLQAESQVQEAQAHILDAAGRITSAQTAPYQVAASRMQVASSEAEIAQARANVKQAALQLAYTRIYAPSSGRITRKTVEMGAYVQVGQALLAVVQPDIWVTANFKETQLDRMRPGQPVKIYVDAYHGRPFKGHVDSIQSGSGARFSLLPPENASGNYVKVVQRVPVKIVFDEPPAAMRLLTPGLSVVPEVELQ